MKTETALSILLLVMVASAFASQFVYAQSTQVSSNVTLSHLNAQLTYPSEVLPGQSVTVNVKAQAKDGFQLASLTVQVYLADQSNLRQLVSATVAQNLWMASGNQINKDVQATVPLDASRTSLIALVSESVRTSYYDYSYYYPFWSSYFSSNYASSYSYPYYYFMYPSYYYTTTSDDVVAPLSYVKATTPEYNALQSQYQQLQQTLNATQAQNKKLQQDLQTAQGSISQKDSTIGDLNRQLASTQNTTTLLEIIALILVAVTVVLAIERFRLAKGKAVEDTERRETSTTSQKP
jgi:hypothetical protein